MARSYVRQKRRYRASGGAVSVSAPQVVGSVNSPGGTSTTNSPAAWLARSGTANWDEFMLEAWLRCDPGSNTGGTITEGATYVNDATDGPIFMDSDDGTNGSCFILGLADGVPYFGVRCSGGDATRIANTDIRDSAWHHVVWAREPTGGQIRIWVDGVLEEDFNGPNGSIAYPGGGTANDGRHVLFKEKQNFTLGYDGDTSELRVINDYDFYGSGNFTPPSAPLTAVVGTLVLMHFESSGSPLVDSSGNGNNFTAQGNALTHSNDDPF